MLWNLVLKLHLPDSVFVGLVNNARDLGNTNIDAKKAVRKCTLSEHLDTDGFPQSLCLAFVSGSRALFTGSTNKGGGRGGGAPLKFQMFCSPPPPYTHTHKRPKKKKNPIK